MRKNTLVPITVWSWWQVDSKVGERVNIQFCIHGIWEGGELGQTGALQLWYHSFHVQSQQWEVLSDWEYQDRVGLIWEAARAAFDEVPDKSHLN